MMTPDELDVSRETMKRLQIYADLLEKWNPRINLVSRSSIKELWTRHILDSAQILALAPNPCKNWVDLGSGGGFPGLVVSIMGMEADSPTHVSLVESDLRKSTFLRTVIRETGAPASVLNARIEEIDPLEADVLSARALADLTDLLEFTQRHMTAGGTAIFPKGVKWEKELEAARSQWKFDYQIAKSITESGPVILSVTGVSRA